MCCARSARASTPRCRCCCSAPSRATPTSTPGSRWAQTTTSSSRSAPESCCTASTACSPGLAERSPVVVIGGALIVGATAAVLGSCVLLVLLVVAVRARRHRRQRREAMLLSPLRSPLIEVASGEDDDGAAVRQLTGATGASRAVLDRNIVALLTKIRGVPADQLVDVLEAHGSVEAAALDLGRRSPVRRAKAAQLLGLARASRAVPLLVGAL